MKPGDRFGLLTVLVQVNSCVKVQCRCGIIKDVRRNHLYSGATQSCGCLRRLSTHRLFTTHGRTNTPEYHAWRGMKQRCYVATTDSFPRYGGRGIKVCKRWLRSFSNFLKDMGTRPSQKHSLDRKNNHGHYTPLNCRWATSRQQALNRG